MHQWDLYCYDIDTEQWWGMNETGLKDRLRRNAVYAYKEGRTVTNKVYRSLMERADKDPDFPQIKEDLKVGFVK